MIENLRRRIEKEGQLYIPGYASERVRNCINDLGWLSYTDDCINDAWRELKREYRKRSYPQVIGGEIQALKRNDITVSYIVTVALLCILSFCFYSPMRSKNERSIL